MGSTRWPDKLKEVKRLIEDEIHQLQLIYQVHSHELVPDANALSPPELFHYTTIEGLRGILENRCLWATHYESLNDSTEVVHGRMLFARIVQERIEHCSELPKLLLHSMLDGHGNIFENICIYLACLCENGDLLSQWRAYSNGGKGFALGMKPRMILQGSKPTLPSPQQFGFGVTKVIYDEKKQHELFYGLVDRVFTRVEDILPISLNYIKDVGQLHAFLETTTSPLLAAMLYLNFQMCYRVKNPAFQEEKEWRLVCIMGNEKTAGESTTPEVKHRTRNGVDIPYIEIPIHSADPNEYCFDVTRIICGPTLQPDSMRAEIGKLLKASGFNGVIVEKSQIPLRE